MSKIPDNKRRKCADNALHAYGTAFIFEKRASAIQFKIVCLSFLGIAVPALVGAIVGGYNINLQKMGVILFVASTASIFQLVLSIWSLASGWASQLSNYLNLKNKNYFISEKYETLGKETEYSLEIFNNEYSKFDIENNLIKELTGQFSINEKEKRRGMRYALRKFQRKCAGCKKIPYNIKSSKCGVCGNF